MLERLLSYQGGERIPVRYIQDIRITIRSLPATPFSIFNCFHWKWNFLYNKVGNALVANRCVTMCR